MVEKEMVTGINLDVTSKANFCEVCIKAKASHKSFPKESKIEYKTYSAKVVADVWGPAPDKSLGGKEYFLLQKFSNTTRSMKHGLKSRGGQIVCWVATEVVNL